MGAVPIFLLYEERIDWDGTKWTVLKIPIGVAMGTDVEGGQDEPNIGTLYFEPNPSAHNQAEAERQAIEAAKENLSGTYLRFILEADKKVRFWVSDFDYTDNSGMVKLKIRSVSK